MLGVAGFVGAIFFTPWVPLAAVILLSLRFRAYEAIALGLFMDLMWLPAGFMSSVPWCTLIAFVIVFALEPLRVQLLR